jgi:hypothetical protein
MTWRVSSFVSTVGKRQVCQKRLDLCVSHLVRMSFVVEENVALNPGHIGFLRAH